MPLLEVLVRLTNLVKLRLLTGRQVDHVERWTGL
jgi:hypothetical protein